MGLFASSTYNLTCSADSRCPAAAGRALSSGPCLSAACCGPETSAPVHCCDCPGGLPWVASHPPPVWTHKHTAWTQALNTLHMNIRHERTEQSLNTVTAALEVSLEKLHICLESEQTNTWHEHTEQKVGRFEHNKNTEHAQHDRT